MRNVAVALTVLEAVAARAPVGVSELAKLLVLPKTTVQRSLRALAVAGWITPQQRDSSTKWVLTRKPVLVFSRATQPDQLQVRAQQVMRDLARQTKETIHLTVPDGAWVVLLDKIESVHEVRTVSWVGGRAPIHATSSGLAILAAQSDADVRVLLASGIETYTDLSLPSVDSVISSLGEVRKCGYAINPGMWRREITAIGAAILGPEGDPLGAISISTPAHRLPTTLQPTYGALVRDAAALIGFGS